MDIVTSCADSRKVQVEDVKGDICQCDNDLYEASNLCAVNGAVKSAGSKEYVAADTSVSRRYRW